MNMNENVYLETVFRELYQGELERMDKLRARLVLPLGLILMLWGVCAYYLDPVRLFSVDANGILGSTYRICALVAAYATMRGSYCLIRSHYNYGYGYVPSPADLFDHFVGLMEYFENVEVRKYFEAYGQWNVAEQATADFRVGLVREYSRNAQINHDNNNSKSAYLHNASTAIIVSLVFNALGLLPLVFLQSF